jgi:hypothetical protein
MFGCVGGFVAGIVSEGMAGRADVVRDGAHGGALRGWRLASRRDGGRNLGTAEVACGGRFVRGEQGRQPASAEIREQADQRVENTQQGQTDSFLEQPHDQPLVTPRRDGLAHVVQDERQIGIGVKLGGVGHDSSIRMIDEF